MEDRNNDAVTSGIGVNPTTTQTDVDLLNVTGVAAIAEASLLLNLQEEKVARDFSGL